MTAPNASTPPAVALLGRKNSGKTTLAIALIAELVARAWKVGSIKHHSQPGFDIDVPGKDSWRHAQAGSSHVVVGCPNRVASYRDLEEELPLSDLIASMTDVGIVVVEGYRDAGIPSVEIIRSGSERDMAYLAALENGEANLPVNTLCLASDSPRAYAFGASHNLPVVPLDDASALADLVLEKLFPA